MRLAVAVCSAPSASRYFPLLLPALLLPQVRAFPFPTAAGPTPASPASASAAAARRGFCMSASAGTGEEGGRVKVLALHGYGQTADTFSQKMVSDAPVANSSTCSTWHRRLPCHPFPLNLSPSISPPQNPLSFSLSLSLSLSLFLSLVMYPSLSDCRACARVFQGAVRKECKSDVDWVFLDAPYIVRHADFDMTGGNHTKLAEKSFPKSASTGVNCRAGFSVKVPKRAACSPSLERVCVHFGHGE